MKTDMLWLTSDAKRRSTVEPFHYNQIKLQSNVMPSLYLNLKKPSASQRGWETDMSVTDFLGQYLLSHRQ